MPFGQNSHASDRVTSPPTKVPTLPMVLELKLTIHYGESFSILQGSQRNIMSPSSLLHIYFGLSNYQFDNIGNLAKKNYIEN